MHRQNLIIFSFINALWFKKIFITLLATYSTLNLLEKALSDFRAEFSTEFPRQGIYFAVIFSSCRVLQV